MSSGDRKLAVRRLLVACGLVVALAAGTVLFALAHRRDAQPEATPPPAAEVTDPSREVRPSLPVAGTDRREAESIERQPVTPNGALPVREDTGAETADQAPEPEVLLDVELPPEKMHEEGVRYAERICKRLKLTPEQVDALPKEIIDGLTAAATELGRVNYVHDQLKPRFDDNAAAEERARRKAQHVALILPHVLRAFEQLTTAFAQLRPHLTPEQVKLLDRELHRIDRERQRLLLGDY